MSRRDLMSVDARLVEIVKRTSSRDLWESL